MGLSGSAAGELNDWTCAGGGLTGNTMVLPSGQGNVPFPWANTPAANAAHGGKTGSYINPFILFQGSAAQTKSSALNANFTGVVGVQSEVSLRQVTDGTSKVYLFGEKSMSIWCYGSFVGGDQYSGSADEESIYNGFDDDFIRLGSTAGWAAPPGSLGAVSLNPTASLPPQPDTNLWPSDMSPAPTGVTKDPWVTYRFGSAHASAFNMAFVDGSVHAITYDIDPAIHGQLSNRQDGATPDQTLYLAP